MTLVDTSGWLHYFLNGPLIERYAKFLEKSDTVLTPTIVLYEVYKKVKVQSEEKYADVAASQMNRTVVVSLSDSIAYSAADLSLEYKLAMADAIIYATALEHRTQLITSDADFKGLPGVLYLSPEG